MAVEAYVRSDPLGAYTSSGAKAETLNKRSG